MPKTSKQLDAEITEALKASKPTFEALIARVEQAIDAHPELTRARPGNRGVANAELCFRDGGWVAQCEGRNKLAKGRGAKVMATISRDGGTPEEAVENLIDTLDITAQAWR